MFKIDSQSRQLIKTEYKPSRLEPCIKNAHSKSLSFKCRFCSVVDGIHLTKIKIDSMVGSILI